jgi:hypothetical protein
VTFGTMYCAGPLHQDPHLAGMDPV